jgi:hypothetical protein
MVRGMAGQPRRMWRRGHHGMQQGTWWQKGRVQDVCWRIAALGRGGARSQGIVVLRHGLIIPRQEVGAGIGLIGLSVNAHTRDDDERAG